MRAVNFSSSLKITGRVVVSTLAVLLSPHSLAQTEPVFRTTSEVVLVPASVLNKSGKPVTGLKSADFELRVDGRRLSIQALSEISGPIAATTNARPLPPDTVTNVAAAEVSQRSWVVLLVDFINTSPSGRMELRNQLLKFLTKDLKPGQQMAIYALSGSLVLLHPFTSDTRPLIEAASRLMHEKGAPAAPADAGFLGAIPTAVAGVIAAAPGGPASLAPGASCRPHRAICRSRRGATLRTSSFGPNGTCQSLRRIRARRARWRSSGSLRTRLRAWLGKRRCYG